MTSLLPLRSSVCLLLTAALAAPVALAQTPAPPPAVVSPPIVAAPPPSPISGIRNKISAGDLLSAESILEVYRAKYGVDGAAVVGLSWLARGALLLREPVKAKRYSGDVRQIVTERIGKGTDLEKDGDLEYALGSVLEVEAQLIERASGTAKAVAFVRGELARWPRPMALQMRLQKRLDLLTLTGSPAPEWVVEDFVGAAPPTLGSLRGEPVLVFIWSATCSDCKAQAAALAKVRAKHPELSLVALTRYSEDEATARVAEKARVDSVWKAVYSDVGPAPVVFSTESMIRYGGSSTPTLVFIDRRGIVRRYSPTRMTEAELDRSVSELLR